MNLLQKLNNISSDIEWSYTADVTKGLFSTNSIFQLAKRQGVNPVELAYQFTVELRDKLPKGLSISNTGPYINIDLDDQGYIDILSNGDKIEPTNDSPIIFEYISPNVAKPLHAGHVRNADISEAILRCLQTEYKNIVTECFWGDWGKQFGILLWAYNNLKDRESFEIEMNGETITASFNDYDSNPVDTLVKVYVWGNQQENSEEYPDWDQEIKELLVELESGSTEYDEVRARFKRDSVKESRRVLNILGSTEHQLNEGESFYLEEANKLREYLDEKKLWKKDGKARYIDYIDLEDKWKNCPYSSKQLKALGRCYFISSNGYSSYALRDSGARISWQTRYSPSKLITITAGEQQHHFKQLFAFLRYLDDLGEIEEYTNGKIKNFGDFYHIHYGFLTLPEGKMSTRKGNFLTASQLIEHIQEEARKVLKSKNAENVNDTKVQTIAIAALKWYDLSRDMEQDLVLNIPEILKFEGNTGVYQLYTIARLKSILRKSEIDITDTQSELADSNFTEEEQIILRSILILPSVIEKVSTTYKPHLLTNHLYEFSSRLNTWYAKTRVLDESEQTKKLKYLHFIKRCVDHIDYTLSLLAIKTIEEL